MISLSTLFFFCNFVAPCNVDDCINCDTNADQCDTCIDGYDDQEKADEAIYCLRKLCFDESFHSTPLGVIPVCSLRLGDHVPSCISEKSNT